MDATIAALVPVLGRPQNVRPLVDSFHAAGSEHAARLYFIAQRGDDEEIYEVVTQAGMGRCDVVMVEPEEQSWAKKINAGYRATSEPWMLLLGDDVSFTSGWLHAFAAHASSGAGVIGTSDGSISVQRHERQWRRKERARRGDPAPPPWSPTSPHPFVSRAYVDEFGTVDEIWRVVHDGYHHNFPDTELCATARMRGKYAYAHDVAIVHNHPIYGRSSEDDTYRIGRSRWSDDERLFNERRERFGLP